MLHGQRSVRTLWLSQQQPFSENMYFSVLVAVLGQCVEHILFFHCRSVPVKAIAMHWDRKEEDGAIIITMWLPWREGRSGDDKTNTYINGSRSCVGCNIWRILANVTSVVREGLGTALKRSRRSFLFSTYTLFTLSEESYSVTDMKLSPVLLSNYQP